MPFSSGGHAIPHGCGHVNVIRDARAFYIVDLNAIFNVEDYDVVVGLVGRMNLVRLT